MPIKSRLDESAIYLFRVWPRAIERGCRRIVIRDASIGWLVLFSLWSFVCLTGYNWPRLTRKFVETRNYSVGDRHGGHVSPSGIVSCRASEKHAPLENVNKQRVLLLVINNNKGTFCPSPSGILVPLARAINPQKCAAFQERAAGNLLVT